MKYSLTHPTVGQLREWLADLPPESKVILVDPDTGWLLKPSFFFDETDNSANITADYYSDRIGTP